MIAVQKQINSLRRKFALILGKGLIHGVDDDYQAQATFLSDEPKDKTHIVQHYGFTFRPLKNADCYGICPGNRDNLIIIATDDKRYRLSVKSGEIALYTDEGDYIHFKRGNKIEIKSKNISITQKDKNYELISIIHDVIDGLEQALTSTMLGPQPLSTKAIFTQAKQKIKTFMESS